MNLSLVKKLGALHVRAGKVAIVIASHAVKTDTYNPKESHEDNRRTFTKPWMTANVGDVAIEIAAVATGNVIGHTYISGDAVGLYTYNGSATWYRDGVGRIARTDVSPDDLTLEQFIQGVLSMKYADADVVAIRVVTGSLDDSKAAGQAFAEAYGYTPDPTADAPALVGRSHMLAMINDGKLTSRSGGVALHFQPPHQSQQHAASFFQNALVQTAEWPRWDPFAAAKRGLFDFGNGDTQL